MWWRGPRSYAVVSSHARTGVVSRACESADIDGMPRQPKRAATLRSKLPHTSTCLAGGRSPDGVTEFVRERRIRVVCVCGYPPAAAVAPVTRPRRGEGRTSRCSRRTRRGSHEPPRGKFKLRTRCACAARSAVCAWSACACARGVHVAFRTLADKRCVCGRVHVRAVNLLVGDRRGGAGPLPGTYGHFGLNDHLGACGERGTHHTRKLCNGQD